jgi:hypothetical protein
MPRLKRAIFELVGFTMFVMFMSSIAIGFAVLAHSVVRWAIGRF